MAISTISAELLIFLQPNVIGWYIIIGYSVLCKDCIVVFKVKITVKAQNFIESLCTLYLLYRWFLGSQSRYADLLFKIAKPSTTKWAYTDSSFLTYTRHTVGEYFAVWGDSPGIQSIVLVFLVFSLPKPSVKATVSQTFLSYFLVPYLLPKNKPSFKTAFAGFLRVVWTEGINFIRCFVVLALCLFQMTQHFPVPAVGPAWPTEERGDGDWLVWGQPQGRDWEEEKV